MIATTTSRPRVSVHWLNFNSLHVIETTKKSLEALSRLDYPNYELVVVDIGSNDGSDKIIERHLQTGQFSRLRVVFVKINADVGPIDGENAAFKARDKAAKYIALMHSDVIAEPDYLTKLIGYLENHPDVGAAQGIVVRIGYDHKVDSSGFILDEALNLHAVHDTHKYSLTKPLLVSYVEATMAVYSVEAIENTIKADMNLFVPGAFMNYLEDVLMSVLFWSRGYKSVVLPLISGEHLRMATTGKHVSTINQYHIRLRNQVALLCITNSADKLRFILQVLRRAVLSKASFTFRQMMLRSVIEGVQMARQLRKLYGVIDLYKTPMMKTPLKGRLRI